MAFKWRKKKTRKNTKRVQAERFIPPHSRFVAKTRVHHLNKCIKPLIAHCIVVAIVFVVGSKKINNKLTIIDSHRDSRDWLHGMKKEFKKSQGVWILESQSSRVEQRAKKERKRGKKQQRREFLLHPSHVSFDSGRWEKMDGIPKHFTRFFIHTREIWWQKIGNPMNHELTRVCNLKCNAMKWNSTRTLISVQWYQFRLEWN